MSEDMNESSDAPSSDQPPKSDTESPKSSKSPWWNWKLLAVGLPVTLGLLYVAAPKQPEEVAQLKEAFRTANYWLLPPFFLCLFAFYWLKAYRWRLLLTPVGDFSTSSLVPSMMIGFGVNNVVPAHLGELARVGVFWKQSKVPFSSVFSTVALERLFDLIAILSLLGIGLVLVEGLDPTIKQIGLYVAAVTAVGLVGAAVYVFFTEQVLAVVRWAFRVLPLPESFEGKVLALAESGAAGLRAIRSPGLLIGVTAISFAKWLLNGLLTWIALDAFDIEISAAMAFVLLGAVALAVTIPATPGYFGVIQATFWVVLQTQPDLADRKGDVFAASIFYHMAQWIPVTIIGMAYFVRSGLSLTEFTKKEQDTDAKAGLDVQTADGLNQIASREEQSRADDANEDRLEQATSSTSE